VVCCNDTGSTNERQSELTFSSRTWDAFDFFTVSLTVTEIARDFGVENSEVTWVSRPVSVLFAAVNTMELTEHRALP
jgi:hypothetical protein